jgi:hypothetical protein
MGEPNLVDPEKYTEKSFEALQRLPDVAEKFGQQYIEADLLFYSLLQDETAQRFLSKAAGKGSFSSMMRQLAQVTQTSLLSIILSTCLTPFPPPFATVL